MVYSEYYKCKQAYGDDKSCINQKDIEGLFAPSKPFIIGKGIGPVAREQVTDPSPGHSKHSEHKESPMVKTVNL